MTNEPSAAYSLYPHVKIDSPIRVKARFTLESWGNRDGETITMERPLRLVSQISDVDTWLAQLRVDVIDRLRLFADSEVAE